MLKNTLKTVLTMSMAVGMLAACSPDPDDMDTTNNINETGQISNLKTDTNSNRYPHTQPIKIQDAKYEFRIVNRGAVPNGNANGNTNANTNNATANQKTQNPTTNNIQQSQSAPAQPAPAQPSAKKAAEIAGENKGSSEYVDAVISLTNKERQKAGLSALTAYPELNDVANVKAQDMNEKGYFSHTSPTYGSPFDMMRDFGIKYKSAGENIAQGQRTPEEVVNAWMNSEGHRANILSKDFSHIGVGFEETGHEWVQMFVKK